MLPVRVSECVDGPPRLGRAYAGHELQESEPRHLVSRIVRETKCREQVLHVRGLEVAQTSVLDEGDPSPGEFDLEVGTVVRRSKQHRLLLQGDALLVELEDAIGDRLRLVAFVSAVDEQRLARADDRDLLAKDRGESFGRVGGDGVGHPEDRAGRPVVDVQGDGREPVEVALGIEQEPAPSRRENRRWPARHHRRW